MNDPKAAAAYHPGDAPVTRPDLDALIAEMRSKGQHSTHLGNRLADALIAERARADQAEQERDSVIGRVIELHDRTDADRYDVDDALMLRGHRAIDADDRLALTRDEWATYYTMIGRNGEATRILDHLAAIVSLRGAEYDLYTPPELAARKAN